MISAVTILGDSDKVDKRLAKKLNIPTKQSKQGVLLEVNAIIDCGADTCVTDAQLRKVLGRDGLPPARGLLQGVGGFDANRNRDILRIVDGGGKVSVTDVREVETLGNSPPDGPKYQQGVMAEFTITPGDPIIHLGTHGSQTRLLIGLKTGDLLGRKLSEEEIIERNLSVPIFSPNLQI